MKSRNWIIRVSTEDKKTEQFFTFCMFFSNEKEAKENYIRIRNEFEKDCNDKKDVRFVQQFILFNDREDIIDLFSSDHGAYMMGKAFAKY